MSRFPSRRLDDKVAVVTGASSGIGYAIAEAMSEAGAKLVLVGRNDERLRRCAGACGEARVVAVDLVADEAPELIVSEALAAFGRIDSIVHSAGIFWPKPLAEAPLEDFDMQWRGEGPAPHPPPHAPPPPLRRARAAIFFSFLPGGVGVSYFASDCGPQRRL